ncbi:DUF192 domain-containing protein [Patescibacteria group bacterium]|nr:DUF192 domain-containing protein [Patescibacteria group bacterium]
MNKILRSLRISHVLFLLIAISTILFALEYINFKDYSKIKIQNKFLYITHEEYSEENTLYTGSKSYLGIPVCLLTSFEYDSERPVIGTDEFTKETDIIWIDRNLRVVDIKNSVQPCNTNPCTRIASQKRVKYLLFAPNNWTTENNIQTGDVVSL